MAETCTKRSLDFLRKNGYRAWITESSMQFPDKKFDVHAEASALIVKVLSSYGHGARVTPELVAEVSKKIRIPMIPMKRDLWNFADLAAVKSEINGTTYVQTTTRDHQAERLKKILESPHAQTILEAGNKIHVHGWAKVGARGKAKHWQVTVTDVTFVNGSMTPVLLDVAEKDPEPTLFPKEVPARDVADDFDEGEVAV
jgi:hypothetical protein